MSLQKKIAFQWAHWANQSRPFRSVVAHLLAKIGMSGWFSYRRNGVRIKMRSAGLARLLWADPSRCLDGELFLSRFLKDGDVFVDVGANIGILTLLASKIVGPEGKVVSVEAHPQTHGALLQNLQLNRITNVAAVNCAVGREDGTVRLSDRLDDDWNKIDTAGGTVEVGLRRLDEVCEALAQINVLKIDVEGYELPVLEGAVAVLERTQCVLLECWEEHTKGFGYCARDLIQFFEQYSFRGFLLVESGDEVFLTLISDRHVQRELENYVFVRDAGVLGGSGFAIQKQGTTQ
jgi:FkbM family methyltransferase